MRLEAFERLVEGKRCRWCGAPLSGPIHHYPHPGGWKVEGFPERQWLYVICPGCGYQWALWKLGIPGDVHHLPKAE